MRKCLNSLMLGMCCLLLADLPAARSADDTAKGAAGYWFGKLQVETVELRFGFNISRKEDGSLAATFDCPDGGEKDVPIDEVEFRDTTLHLRMKSRRASFNGKLNPAANEIVGKWKQAGRSVDLTLKRTDQVAVETRRPQHPKRPYPYLEEEVTYKSNLAGVTLAGTLTLPRGDGPFLAVLLITGSGPQDRDETIFEHKPFLVLADHLTRQGIAVLRVDDRGVGQSTVGSETDTSEDFAADVSAGVAFLKGRKDIHPQRIGLVGHSEGGMIAPMVAAQSKDVAFIVLLAGTGVSGGDILVRQKQLLLQTMAVSEEVLKRRLDVQQRAFAIVKSEKDDKAAALKLRDMFRKEEQKLSEVGKNDPELSQPAADLFIAGLQNPWMRFFVTFDPRTALARVRCSVLAINGEKDQQVDPKQNLPAIEAALKEAGNRDYTIREFPNLNHFFQNCQTGLPSEYAKIEETIAPVVLEFVADWINHRNK